MARRATKDRFSLESSAKEYIMIKNKKKSGDKNGLD